MKNALTELIEKFEECLRINNAPILSRLQRGLTKVDIHSLLIPLQMMNTNLLTLYKWRNGIKYDSEWVAGDLDFFFGGIMLSLGDAIEAGSILANGNFLKNDLLIPVFTTGVGDYVLFNNNEKDDNYEKLLLYSPSLLLSNEPVTIYNSLTSFFNTIIECYKCGAYSFKQGALEIDYDLEQQVSRGQNPGIAYWR